MADKSPVPRPYAGRSGEGDPTGQPGQYPPMGANAQIFGGPLPDGTGAPGTPGASGGADATNEPGQLDEGFAGVTEAQVTETGAPGSQGAKVRDGGPDAVSYTPLTAGIGANEWDTTSDSVSGPDDWTGANDNGYATGGPQLPGIKGNEPEAGSGRFQPGGGSVLRGGRAVRG